MEPLTGKCELVRRLCAVLAALLFPFLLLVAVEFLAGTSSKDFIAVVPPSRIATSIFVIFQTANAGPAALHTLLSVFCGTLIGGGLGLVIGIWLALVPRAGRYASLAIEVFRPIPPVALIPLALLSFGFGVVMEVSIVGFGCFWPMLLMSKAAVSEVDIRLHEVARLLHLSPLQRVLKVVLPAAARRIFVALRLTVGIAFVVAVTTEIAANPLGLGAAIVSAQEELRPADMYAFLFWIALLGLAISYGLLATQRRLFR